MGDGLSVDVVGARAEAHAAAPTVLLRLRVATNDGDPVHALALRAQIRVEPQRRTYTEAEEAQLVDLFGAPDQWSRSLRPFLWTEVATMVGAFAGATELDLPVPCTYDMEVSGARYLHGLDGGDIPLLLLFTGTAFGAGAAGGFSARPVSWSTEAAWRLPVGVWREAIDRHFPNSGWLRLHAENLDGLLRFKAARGLPTWDQTIERLLKEVGEP